MDEPVGKPKKRIRRSREDERMQTQTETEETDATTSAENETPSAEFVRAVSDLLDTDPADLLAELGYYDRSGETAEAGEK